MWSIVFSKRSNNWIYIPPPPLLWYLRLRRDYFREKIKEAAKEVCDLLPSWHLVLVRNLLIIVMGISPSPNLTANTVQFSTDRHKLLIFLKCSPKWNKQKVWHFQWLNYFNIFGNVDCIGHKCRCSDYVWNLSFLICKFPAVRIDWTANKQALLGQTSIQTPWH